MNIVEGQHQWISEEKIYLPTSQGGLNCIELQPFFHSIRLKWVKRYIVEKYDNFWTSILDDSLGISKTNRGEVLEWGHNNFDVPINKCKSKLLRQMLVCLKQLSIAFFSNPGTSDDRFIYQPIFNNYNLKHVKLGKKVVFEQSY